VKVVGGGGGGGGGGCGVVLLGCDFSSASLSLGLSTNRGQFFDQ